MDTDELKNRILTSKTLDIETANFFMNLLEHIDKQAREIAILTTHVFELVKKDRQSP